VRQSERKIKYKKQKKVRKKLTSLADEFYSRYQERYNPAPQEGKHLATNVADEATINEMDQEN
jgi:hypothetical protein